MIEKRKKGQKIFYVPGMISLVLIPLFCYYHFFKVEAFKTYGSLDFSVPNKEEFEKYRYEDLRKYKLFYFNNQRSKEEQKLKELRFFSQDLMKHYDTINGVKIQFGQKTDYDTFVQVLNIMNEEEMPTWALFSDKLYAFTHSKTKLRKKPMYICGTGEYSERNSRLIEEENRKKELHIFQIQFFKQQWLILLGYVGIVLINIVALVKFNKTKKYNQK